MSQKTKTVIEETTDAIDPKSLELLGYRVGQLEKASKEAATAQRDGVDMLSSKIDGLAHNFVSQADLASAQREATLQHTIINDEMRTKHSAHEKRLAKIESWLTWAGRIVIGAVIAAVIGLVLVTKSTGL